MAKKNTKNTKKTKKKKKDKTTVQTTHVSVVNAVLVAKPAPNAETSLIWLSSRLQSRFVNNGRNKKS